MKFRILSYIVCCCFFVFACRDNSTYKNLDRPHDPWVFRSVLDGIPRVITLALDEELWVAYTTENGAMYKAWKGWVLLDGPVYTTRHGPQPVSVGDAYVINEYTQPWIIKKADQEVSFTYQYKGHRYDWPHVSLLHEFQLNDGKIIQLEERVEYTEKESGQRGLERVFTSSGIPESFQLGSKMNVSSIIIEDHVQTNGTWEIVSKESVQFERRTALELEGILWFNPNEETFFTCYFTEQPLIPNDNPASETEKLDPSLPDGAKLIAKSDCRTCHNDKVKTVGPAYVDVAKRYKNNNESIELLVNKVINGGSGIWGTQMMNPHPNLSKAKARTMIEYILSIDDSTEEETEREIDEEILRRSLTDLDLDDQIPGAYTRIYNIPSNITRIPAEKSLQDPIMAGVMPGFDNLSGKDFKELDESFALYASGLLNVPKTQKYSFRIWSDDGSKFYLHNELLIDHDGEHGTSFKEATVKLEKGPHPFKLEYYQGAGDKFLSLNWKAEDQEKWEVIPPYHYSHAQKLHVETIDLKLPMANVTNIPGDQNPVSGVHPAFDLSQARPEDFKPMVAGMDFMDDGRLAVSTWDAEGAVYLVSNVETGDTSKMSVKKVAWGLAEPLGLKVVDGDIYVMQKQEVTRLIDHNGDEIIDEYQTLSDDWWVSSNFHEFGFGLEYKDGYFYATLATAIEPGGASTQPQIPDRGKVIKVSKETGELEFIAHGLRTPNGIGLGVDDDIFVADNQGDWLPSSKIVHVKPGAWYGSRSVNFEGTKDMEEDLPLVWLPQDEIGNSPSTPAYLNHGPYQGQMIHGEVTHGGVKRVFVEEVNGAYQGAVFRFIQGLEAGVNRLCWGPDEALYVGGIGNPGNWGHAGKKWYGLQRLEYNGNSVFEMLAVRANTNGLELEFTEAIELGVGWDAKDYEVRNWYYLPTEEYGGPKMDEKKLEILSVHVSENRKKVFLELDEMESNHVYYVRISNHFVSEKNHSLWSSEAWYTMNSNPENDYGFKTQTPKGIGLNRLTDAEKKEGWKLLFDGITMDQWKGYKKENVSHVWRIEENAMTMDTVVLPNGTWHIEGKNDIITKKQYENFELKLEWKIQNCGNSGIFFLVQELEDYNEAYYTGPEMQILDNVCHTDGKSRTHRAGDLYDLLSCKFVSVKPAGEWNNVRIKINDGKAEHWLNGHKVVEYELWTEEWDQMVANSKFKDWPMAKTRKGHIALQDHDDKVWFRNIKIREL